MSIQNDWKAFRKALEVEGVVYSQEGVSAIPSVQRRNTNRWNHLRRMVRMVQKKDKSFVANAQLDVDVLFERMVQLLEQDKKYIYALDELLGVLYELDNLEGEFDFEGGSTLAYVKRVKQAFATGKKEYSWRKGMSESDFEKPYLIGVPPNIPRPPSDEP